MALFRNLLAMIRKPYYSNVPLFQNNIDLSWIPDGGTNIVVQYPAETPDGVIVAFTFQSEPKYIVWNGQLLKPPVGFTVVGVIATMATPPEVGAEFYGIV